MVVVRDGRKGQASATAYPVLNLQHSSGDLHTPPRYFGSPDTAASGLPQTTLKPPAHLVEYLRSEPQNTHLEKPLHAHTPKTCIMKRSKNKEVGSEQ